MDVLRSKPKYEIWIMGWNARKFDSQFLMPEILKRYVLDFSLTGTPTNPKNFRFGDRAIMMDARDMVGGGTLDSFASSMGAAGKKSSARAMEIDSYNAWRESPHQAEIIAYCQQDVKAMKESVWIFNNNTIALLKRIRDITIEIPGARNFILKPTIAKLSYDLFRMYLSAPGMDVGVNTRPDVYAALKASYRGGYVQPFVFGMFTPDPGRKVWYLDVNSLYPSVMCSGRLPLEMKQEVCRTNSFPPYFSDLATTRINPLSLYRVTSFELGKAAKFGWFAVPVKVERETKNVYLNKAVLDGVDGREAIWVWGVELMALRSCLPTAKVSISHFIGVARSGMLLRAAALLYDLRLAAKRERRDAEAAAMKSKMNNVYGRFGMKCYDQSFYMLSRDQMDCVSQEDYDLIVANSHSRLLRSQNQLDVSGDRQMHPRLKDVAEGV